MMKRYKRVLNLLRIAYKASYWLVLIGLVLIAGLVSVSTFDIPGNYKLLVVQSGSMEPAVKKGSIVVVKPFGEYRVGDIITVKESASHQLSVTHRISEVKEKDGRIFYVTKGDANKTADLEERSKENVLGKVLFSLPYLGYPVAFAKTRDGLIILVIIPATLIVYSELLKIKSEAKRLLRERKRKLSLKEKLELEIGKEEIEAERGIKRFIKRIEIFLSRKR